MGLRPSVKGQKTIHAVRCLVKPEPNPSLSCDDPKLTAVQSSAGNTNTRLHHSATENLIIAWCSLRQISNVAVKSKPPAGLPPAGDVVDSVE